MGHQNDIPIRSRHHCLERIENDKIPVDVEHRIRATGKEMVEDPWFDDGDELSSEEQGHPMDFRDIDVKIFEPQCEKWLMSIVDRSIDVIDQENPKLLAGMMTGKGSGQDAGMGHIRPRDDRISDHACCTFLRFDVEGLVS
jgi:hypothetical protein